MSTKERLLLTKRLRDLAKIRRKITCTEHRDEIARRMLYMIRILDPGRHFHN